MTDTKKGRKIKADPIKVAAWRQAREASIAETAKRFGISEKTVSNYCKQHGDEARIARERWRWDREMEEVRDLEFACTLLEVQLRNAREAHEEFQRNPSSENYFEAISAGMALVPRRFWNKRPGAW